MTLEQLQTERSIAMESIPILDGLIVLASKETIERKAIRGDLIKILYKVNIDS